MMIITGAKIFKEKEKNKFLFKILAKTFNNMLQTHCLSELFEIKPTKSICKYTIIK